MKSSANRRSQPGAAGFSRTGSTSPFGKFDDWLERTRIEGYIKEQFTSKAAAAAAAAGVSGKPAAEFVRDMVRVAALGPHEARRMYGEGVLVVWRMVTETSDKT